MAHFTVLHEATDQLPGHTYVLCLQQVILHHDDDTHNRGYRFIYRDATGKLLSHRGQALVDLPAVLRLTSKAIEEGWAIPINDFTNDIPQSA